MTTRTGELVARRRFLGAVVSAAGLVAAGCATTKAASARRAEPGPGGDEAEVTPGEDLMQEHGVLERILLLYDEVVRRIEHPAAFDVATVASAAGIVRRFVEDYHERLEERFVFPRLEAAGREAELVAILRHQHERGRQLTDDVVRRSRGHPTPELAHLLHAFTRMYRPHAAREDTVLFPAFRSVVGGDGYRELGEHFDAEEHARFGEHGFEQTVSEVAQLEAALGIADLAGFTPP